MLTPPQALETLLFTSGGPLKKKKAIALLGITESELTLTLEALSKQLEGRGLSVIEIEEEIELRTNANAADIVKKSRESEFSHDLGKASLETLAIIAYQNGVTRGEIDWVRGVNSSASLRTLLLRGLIEGQTDKADKRRMRYSLTTEALAHLGLKKTEELPRYEELSSGATHIIKTNETDTEKPVTTN